jgi:hypothetical protein
MFRRNIIIKINFNRKKRIKKRIEQERTMLEPLSEKLMKMIGKSMEEFMKA